MKPMFYKEWIKTRWYLLLSFLLSMGFVIFAILRMQRVVEIKGASHLWEIMLVKDVVFIDIIRYIPVLIGILFAAVQFMPEMYHKRLKLTLHLPVAHLKTTNMMLFYGILVLAGCFALNFITLYIYLHHIFAVELYSRILLTAIPWYLAGICSYLLISWICLEPTWKMRILNLIVSALILKIFFISDAPESYNGFLPGLTIYTLLTICLSWNSIHRFKCGKQD